MNSTIKNCFSTVSILTNNSSGGLIGLCDTTTIINAYTTSPVNAAGNNPHTLGAMIGLEDIFTGGPSIYQNCITNIDTANVGVAIGYGLILPQGVIAVTTEQMQQVHTYANWSFADYDNNIYGHWTITENQMPIPAVFHEYNDSTIPDVTAMNASQALEAFNNQGLDVAVINQVYSLSVPAGIVTGLSASFNQPVNSNTSDLEIYVSLGNNGDGSNQSPYPIACQRDIQYLAAHPELYDKCFRLTADIYFDRARTYPKAIIAYDQIPLSLNQKSFESEFSGTEFTGKLDGANHKIVNMTIDLLSNISDSTDNYSGLFGKLGQNAEISNLVIDNYFIDNGIQYTDQLYSGSHYTGALCGKTAGTTINCSSSGIISSGPKSFAIGGLCGTVEGADIYNPTLLIDSCYSNSYIFADNGSRKMGGLCGGIISANATECHAAGKITAYAARSIGGFVGYNNGLNTLTSNCYSLVDLELYYSDSIGGFVGDNNAQGHLLNCYTAGKMTGGNCTHYAGFCGNNSNKIVSCYWDSQFSGLENGIDRLSDYDNDVTGLTTKQLQNVDTFADSDWDFSYTDGNPAIWQIRSDIDSYPQLTWQFPTGDTNSDMVVDLTDFCQLSSIWLSDEASPCDIDENNLININDLILMLNNWLVEN
ncbi:MAG: PASTA domain-containing protein [Phycisphaerae bacterium]|nr:PASTA domain-containing protein [Phycisphaerae bacterium]